MIVIFHESKIQVVQVEREFHLSNITCIACLLPVYDAELGAPKPNINLNHFDMEKLLFKGNINIDPILLYLKMILYTILN